MGVAGDTLLLSAAHIYAKLDVVVLPLLRPVGNPLEMVLGFFERAIALVDAQRISKIKSTVAVDVKGRHAAGFRGSGVETGKPCIAGGGGADVVRLYPYAIAEETEARIRCKRGTEGVVQPQSQALITIDGIAGEIECRRPSGKIAESRR